MSKQFKARITQQLRDIMFRTRVEVVDAQNFVTLPDKALAQVRAQESSSTSDQNPLLNAAAFHVLPKALCIAGVPRRGTSYAYFPHLADVTSQNCARLFTGAMCHGSRLERTQSSCRENRK